MTVETVSARPITADVFSAPKAALTLGEAEALRKTQPGLADRGVAIGIHAKANAGIGIGMHTPTTQRPGADL